MRREGLAGLNTNRIAERAGISVGTLYGYFPDKTAILVALARRILQEDQAALLAAIDADETGEPLRSLVCALLARHHTDRALRGAVMAVHKYVRATIARRCLALRRAPSSEPRLVQKPAPQPQSACGVGAAE